MSLSTCYARLYVFILQQDDNTQNMPKGQQGPDALTKCLEQILATTYNTCMTETKHNKNPSLMNSGPERTT